MSAFESILLGVVQGITEFLPVSSTGHLILVRELFGIETEFGLAVDATLHLATALAVLLYFRNDLLQLARALFKKVQGIPMEKEMHILFFALALGTIPGVIAGLLLEDTMDTLFRDAHLVAWMLILMSLLFVLAEVVSKRYTEHTTLTVKKGLLVGLFQALALIPGTSRSGATISGGMLLGLSRETSARFAFLLSFPIILGAGSKKMLELGSSGLLEQSWFLIGLGAFSAFLAGIATIHFLLSFLKNHSLYLFVGYRILLALAVLALL
jgi:undecaprenyl-diphosphatase